MRSEGHASILPTHLPDGFIGSHPTLARATTPEPAPRGPHLLDVSMFWGPSGGVRRVLTTKQMWFTRQGWRHSVMAPGVQGHERIDCGGLPLPASGGYRAVLRRGPAARLIERLRPDIVEAADPYTLAWSVLDASRRLGIPSVAFCHSNLPSLAARWAGGPAGAKTRRGSLAARVAQRYLARLYGRFDLVLAPSQGLARQLREWGVPRVVHQGLGVDSSVFSPAAADPAWRWCFEQNLQLAAGTRLLVYSGRFAAEKNLQVLADAVELLGPRYALVAIGSGPLPPRGPRVHLLPPEPDSRRLARLVASCDAYVHAGDQETFGLGVLEAMACGVPVVASSAGGVGELVAGAGQGVDGLRAADFACAIEACVEGPPSVAIGLALRRARAHDWSRIIEQLSQRYIGLLRAPALTATQAQQLVHGVVPR